MGSALKAISNPVNTALSPVTGKRAGNVIDPLGATNSTISDLATEAIMPKIPPVGAAPSVATPPVMPLPDDAAVEEAKRKALALRSASQGRASTILSQTAPQTALSQTLGG